MTRSLGSLSGDEFVENETWEIVTGEQWDALQHIARKSDHVPLCGVKIKHLEQWDLFGYGYLCGKCERMYLEAQP